MASGSLHTALGRHHAHFAVGCRAGCWRRPRGRHVQVGHAFAHSLHHTSRFHADGSGHSQWVQACAVVHVDEVQADGMVADADLAGAGRPTVTSTIWSSSGPPCWRIWTARLMATALL